MKRPPRRCSKPGCGYKVPCPQHTKDERPSARERGYDSRWEQTRRAFLSANPRCVWRTLGLECGVLAAHADHIIPRRRGGSDSWSNLQALCHSHHSEKTARYDGGFGNVRRTG